MKKSKKGKIVKNFKEFVDIEEGWSKIPFSKTQGSGIYALYNDYGLYYVGLTNRSLRSRIRRHSQDRHAGKWNKYSWYQVPRIEHVKDMETIILRIVNPTGNKVKGRFKKKTKR